MPADGEWRFLDLFTQFVRTEYHAFKRSECVRSGFANGLIIASAGYLSGYLFTNSRKKAFYLFSMPAFVLSSVITVAICDMNKAKAMTERGEG